MRDASGPRDEWKRYGLERGGDTKEKGKEGQGEGERWEEGGVEELGNVSYVGQLCILHHLV